MTQHHVRTQPGREGRFFDVAGGDGEHVRDAAGIVSI
jgi:hypothetical protein